jgi:3-methyladenine DNA glycosylase Tag
MNNQFLNHLNSITPQGRAKDTSIFVPAKDINEAVPDVGQNIRGMPKKAGRKFAQALHNLAQDRGSLENYQAARERYTKKKASNAQRQGRNLDRAVRSFKTRTRMDEATSKGDPKRGHSGRAISKVMPGEDPYDKYTRGEIKNFSGKLQKRLNAMSPEGRRSYYQRMGMRSRAASRGGKTQRLFPMTEAPKYAQDAIPAVPELLMLTYSNKHKRDADGLKKFVGKGKKNPMPVYEGAVKASMEDWLSDLPKPVIRELKAKHGKILARTGGHTKGIGGIGAKNSAKLHQSIQGILQKHNVPKLMGSHAEGSNAIQMSFHTFHGDLHEQKEVVYEGAVKASMEDWLYDLPKGAIRELKAKHGKHLAQTGMGGKDPKGLDSSVHGILQKHNVPPLMGSHRNSVDAVKMSFHTFHGDLHEQKEVDDEGGMAMGELKSIIANANDIMSMLKSDSQLEGWVQSKITKSADYISSVKDYLSNTPNSISEEEEKRESTKSMIARLVARGHKKIGKPIPKNVLRDIEKEHKNEDDDYEDD